MRFRNGVCGLVLAASTALPLASAHAQSMNDDDVIAYRQEIMKTMDAQSRAIGMMLAGMVPDKMLSTHFEVLLHAVRQAKLAFEPKVVGGNALPVVWEKHADFVKHFDEAEKSIIQAIDVAKRDGAGGQTGEAAVGALACKACHDIYKKP